MRADGDLAQYGEPAAAGADCRHAMGAYRDLLLIRVAEIEFGMANWPCTWCGSAASNPGSTSLGRYCPAAFERQI